MPWLDVSTLNVVQLGFGFFSNFFAFNSQGFIEEAVIDSASENGNLNTHAGYYSLSIIYAVFTIGNFAAAPIVDILTPKWAMVLGALCYAVFQVGFLFLNEWYLYASSALLGFGASIIWTGQGSYLSQNCTKETTSRNSALLWGMSESSLLAGGIFLFVVFSVQGAQDKIPTSTINILYTVFTVLSLISALIFALLRQPSYPETVDRKNYGKLVSSTFKLMFTKKMLALAFVFAYTGIEQSFWTAGLIFGLMGDKSRKVGRDAIILLGTIVHLVVYALCYINFPQDSSLNKTDDMGGLIEPNLPIALIAGGLLGFGDAIWNTQIYSFLCDTYPKQSAQAFALFKLYQSALSCAAFFYAPVLQLYWHLVILVITSLFGACCFFYVERISSDKSSVRDSYSFETEREAEREGETKSNGDIQYRVDDDLEQHNSG
uniref:UNC93-like protein MFSD11 n=1 Tax=Caenorhabditis japonica TaxID=281687 RepID=A0A8R1DZ47_CAEJA